MSLEIARTDITKITVNGIVTDAKKSLFGGCGVDNRAHILLGRDWKKHRK